MAAATEGASHNVICGTSDACLDDQKARHLHQRADPGLQQRQAVRRVRRRYRIFDSGRKIARLPGPPFQFLDRITGVSGRALAMAAGAMAEAQYDIPADAWYFAAERQPRMPFAVLLESCPAALRLAGGLRRLRPYQPHRHLLPQPGGNGQFSTAPVTPATAGR